MRTDFDTNGAEILLSYLWRGMSEYIFFFYPRPLAKSKFSIRNNYIRQIAKATSVYKVINSKPFTKKKYMTQS